MIRIRFGGARVEAFVPGPAGAARPFFFFFPGAAFRVVGGGGGGRGGRAGSLRVARRVSLSSLIDVPSLPLSLALSPSLSAVLFTFFPSPFLNQMTACIAMTQHRLSKVPVVMHDQDAKVCRPALFLPSLSSFL